jgi:hypothetical protein
MLPSLADKHDRLNKVGSNRYDFYDLMPVFNPSSNKEKPTAEIANQEFYNLLQELYGIIADAIIAQDNPLNFRFAPTAKQIANSPETLAMEATYTFLNQIIVASKLGNLEIKQRKYTEAIQTYQKEYENIFGQPRLLNTMAKVLFTAGAFLLGVVVGAAAGFLAGLPTIIGAIPFAAGAGLALGAVAAATTKLTFMSDDPIGQPMEKVLKKAKKLTFFTSESSSRLTKSTAGDNLHIHSSLSI